MPGNDRARKLVRIMRGERTGVPGRPPAGANVDYPRRVLASGSHAKYSWFGDATVTTVEHSRVFGVYWLERTPGFAHCFFHTNGENEFVYIGQRRPERIMKNRPPPPAFDDATLWESEIVQTQLD